MHFGPHFVLVTGLLAIKGGVTPPIVLLKTIGEDWIWIWVLKPIGIN